MSFAALTGQQVRCPACGEEVTLPTNETIDDGMVLAVVVTDPGTFHGHVRGQHREAWERMCEARRQMNANPFIGGMPRKVDGTFLRPGEDVGD